MRSRGPGTPTRGIFLKLARFLLCRSRGSVPTSRTPHRRGLFEDRSGRPSGRPSGSSPVPGSSPGSAFPCLHIFIVRGLTALGWTAGRPPAPEIILLQAILEIDYTTPEILVKSAGTFEWVSFLKIITPCGAAGSNLQKLPGPPF